MVDATLDALAPDCNVLEGPAIYVEHFYASSGLWLTLAGLQSMRLSLQKGGWRETIVGNLCDVQIRMDEVMARHLVPFM